MLRAFPVGFQKVYKSYLLLLLVLPSLIDTILHSCLLTFSAMIVSDVVTEVLDTELFPQHTITDLNCSITFIVLFSQQRPLP